MPTIVKSADLRNHYNKVAGLCHQQKKPVFVTKNGEGDLAIMSIEAYNELEDRVELYGKLTAGLQQFETGETIDEDEMMAYMDELIAGN
jgi:prevent-host-death family protein